MALARIPAKSDRLPLPPADLRRLYRALKTCREFDERLVKMFRAGEILGTYFPAVGQEACDAVPVFFANEEGDLVLPSHRDLAAAITRGVPLLSLARTILNRSTAQGKGMANPTWWGDTDRSYLAFSPAIGNQYCVGVGAALAFRMRGQKNVALVMLGEGGSSEGALYEGMNFAGLHRLPVIFIIQNNWWAESVPITLQSAVEDLSLRAYGFNMPGIRLNGNDVPGLIAPVRDAVARARNGDGPTLFQFDTYRWYGHSTADPANYRDEAEVEYWKNQDPISTFERWLAGNGVMSAEDLALEAMTIDAAISVAIEQAMSEPEVEDRALYRQYVYCPDGPLPAPIQRRAVGR